VSEARVLEVGRIGRAHGLRGEVAVTFLTDRPERVAPGSTLSARSHDGAPRELVIVESRRHQQRWLLRFEGVDDRDAAASLTGSLLYAPELPGHDEELWVHELVGADVVDARGHALGSVAAIEANPAHDLLVLDRGALIPVTFVVEHGPDGLLEL